MGLTFEKSGMTHSESDDERMYEIMFEYSESTCKQSKRSLRMLTSCMNATQRLGEAQTL